LNPYNRIKGYIEGERNVKLRIADCGLRIANWRLAIEETHNPLAPRVVVFAMFWRCPSKNVKETHDRRVGMRPAEKAA